ncbi:MAG: AMP-binding protein [Deltaproteobacteria bacterium]|nr:AMP-binding protein [Deltaproteobacteria bacterium]
MEITLGTMLKINAAKYPRDEAVIFDDARATYSQLNDRVNKRANALLSLGVKKGDHVATLASNCLELVETIYAIWRIGAVLVPLNIRLSPGELTYIVDHSDVSTVLFLDTLNETITQIKPQLEEVKRFFSFGKNPVEGFIDFEVKTDQQSTQEPSGEIKEEEVATILYTAGTTGKPKGVVATHKNWIWMNINSTAGRTREPGMKSMTVYPLFHAGSIANLTGNIFAGYTLVILKAFDPKQMLEFIQKEKINRLGNPPTVYKMILQQPEISSYDLSSVRYLMSGSEVMPDETRNQLKKVFCNAGIIDNYGMTETCGGTTSRSEEYTAEKPFSVGLPHISELVRVVDGQGEDVASGEVGEIIVRGPNVMREYYKDPEKTAEALRNGWLYTQDLAAVVLKQGEEMTPEEVIEFSKQNLASFKKPKFVEFIDSLPKSPIGKVLRSKLKERFINKALLPKSC